ncbi:MAG TPA: peptidase M50 [Candidatus Oscillibacter excrementigallinarum]|uniref:Peptidase M50 n=1 Tax=Candidatus Oscillibacter excrementigallinarum TaxID=2838716 RepID=A0A9D2LHW7_9FIRM|nr:peptidase M50 [Candidatus Oscillibacter excrementigallinarum]
MSRWCEGLHISGGFWLLAAWFALVNGWRLLAVILSAALLHELGHLAVLGLLGGRVTGLRISVFGAELTTDAARLSYPREIAAVLAGPGVNLLCGLLLAGHHAWVAAGAHLSLCLFNLLPVRPLDGGRALYLLIAALAGPAAGERWARRAGAFTALALGGLAVWLVVRTGGSLWLLPAAAGLLAAGVREAAGRGADFL